jgi:hypothetical protein
MKWENKDLFTTESVTMTLAPIDSAETKRKHAYKILQDMAELSLADCQFYEDSIRRWIADRRTFTAYEISYAVNGELIQAGKVWLRHAVTGNAVHLLVSIYAETAGYESELVDLGPGRVPRLYYPDEAGRREWKSARIPPTPQRIGKALMSPAPGGTPGRSATMSDIAAYANERRPSVPWKDICSAWKREHPDDPRAKTLTKNKVREAWRRHCGDKRGERSA